MPALTYGGRVQGVRDRQRHEALDTLGFRPVGDGVAHRLPVKLVRLRRLQELRVFLTTPVCRLHLIAVVMAIC